MILSDREIQVAIQTKQVTVTPAPREEAFSSTSLDLTLGAKIKRWKAARAKIPGVENEVTFSPGSDGYSYAKVVQEFAEDLTIPSDGMVLAPGEFILAWTSESIDLPSNSRLAARVEGKSSLARVGIGVHLTAPTIHSGFVGQIQLEMFNHGPLRIRLLVGMKICQIIFEQSFGTPGKGYQGMFSGQTE